MTKRAILLEALASTPADVARLARGLDETAAAWRPAGGWSCHDVLAHLVAIEPLYLARLQRIVTENEPTAAALLPDESTHDPALPAAALVELFGELRGMTCGWLYELSPAAWQRQAIHETHGRTTLRFLVQALVAHDIEHTSQLVTIIGQWRLAKRQFANVPEGGL